MPDNRTDRDLLIKLETKFDSMTDLNTKIEKKLDGFQDKLDKVVKDIKDELKNEYVTKADFQRLQHEHEELLEEVRTKYTPLSRFSPVEEVHNDVAKRLRNILISVGVCVLIAAASAPTWLAIYKGSTAVQGAPGIQGIQGVQGVQGAPGGK
jgi:hypothetical protein